MSRNNSTGASVERLYRELDAAETRADDETVVLEVEDTGIGMDPEETDELFEAFVQESEGIGREYEGTGLGLTVAHRIVDEMGGFIEVETRKGGGSCFTVRLPKAEDAT